MARGRTTTLTVPRTAADRQTLLAWQRSRTLPAGQVRRARIIVLLADGASITAITTIIGISRRFVYKLR